MAGKDPNMQLYNSLPWHIRLKISNFPEYNVTKEKIVRSMDAICFVGREQKPDMFFYKRENEMIIQV